MCWSNIQVCALCVQWFESDFFFLQKILEKSLPRKCFVVQAAALAAQESKAAERAAADAAVEAKAKARLLPRVLLKHPGGFRSFFFYFCLNCWLVFALITFFFSRKYCVVSDSNLPVSLAPV